MSLSVDNLVFVRVVDGLPIIDEMENVVLKPVSDCPYLQPMILSDSRLAFAIGSLINKYGQLDTFTSEDYKLENEALLDLKLERKRAKQREFLPLIGVTNRFQNFSVNGIVPDDINNTFSNKKIAVIDPVKYHIDSNLIGLNANDCTIEGDFILSPQGIVLISNDIVSRFDNNYLKRLQEKCKIIYFDGPIKEAIKEAVESLHCPFYEIDKYGFVSSDSEEAQALLNNLCLENGISSSRNFNLLNMGEEKKDIHIVYQYYACHFLNYLNCVSNGSISIDDDMMEYFMSTSLRSNREYESKFIQLIENYCLEEGKINIDKYKLLVGQYNNYLLELSKSGNLLTANQIIEQYDNRSKSL